MDISLEKMQQIHVDLSTRIDFEHHTGYKVDVGLVREESCCSMFADPFPNRILHPEPGPNCVKTKFS